ncbi:hypothetical protein HDF12_003554 [Edaphobacter lichenicola]|uniref:Uncharacterized protein n=2 Tax=Tunturiibacter TaxID=3154218 RepID=A0A7Y9NPG3_9BACT|nr:hypothetical protein [Edaphobacter lichenicola]NYF53155.1 hypothetical protein [Edaphobacter lichenicola]
MKVSTMETIVVSHFNHAPQHSLDQELSKSSESTYNRDSCNDEAAMNS